MKYRKLDDNHDYVFGRNGEDYIDGDEAIAQAIRTKVLLFYGEWWESLGEGIPVFESLLGQVANDNLIRSASLLLTQRILEVLGVLSVDSIDVTNISRTFNFVVHVTTENGQETVEVST